MITRSLGRNGPEVSALGLGRMGMSDFYGPADRSAPRGAVAGERYAPAQMAMLDSERKTA